eukprot:comp21455_c0_seq1/m.29647 comp21455_c0_seq1/g.29647  ORF comp21455_c0_seq1/g.29647 comp21455_c0_seq1/m.29647 type:complete len:360 (-) comp21455_c0_seq1:323-1402(-)
MAPVSMNNSKQLRDHFLTLPQDGAIQAKYVWIDGTLENMRCKSRTLTKVPASPDELPIWNFDGSSTGQAEGEDSDVLIRPVSIFKDPFRRNDNILVMCETLNPDGSPHPTNHRSRCNAVMEKCKAEIPWFGMEQEYTLFDNDGITPLGWPKGGYPGPQGPYYCGVGSNKVFGRDVVEAHYRACIYAGVKIAGSNAEVMPGQWEFQVGPCVGIEMADHLWMARFIMHRVCEDFGVICSMDPKPIPGDWNGAGCHTNFSTEAMRQDGGMKVILDSMPKFEKNHEKHIAVYGKGNERRLTGRHETASIDQFSYGVAHRGSSIRIPRQCHLDGKGYLEDRRPASNCDPYLVTRIICETVLLNM